MTKRICLWSCPRNVSTALMYSFAQRKDTKVFDEPLYAFYLKASGVQHPGRKETLDTMESNGDKVVKDIILGESESPVLFFKLMTHFLIDGFDRSFLTKTKNVLFIRNPLEIIQSYAKVIEHPKMEDIGVKMQYDLFQEFHQTGHLHAILDSKYLLINPKMALQKLCTALEIPFDVNMLSWEAKARPEDGAWAKYWYKGVHQSTGFKPYEPQDINLPSHLQKLADECLPYYNFLSEKSITTF